MFFHAIFIQLVKGILWMDFIIAYIAGRVKGAGIIYRVGGGGGLEIIHQILCRTKGVAISLCKYSVILKTK